MLGAGYHIAPGQPHAEIVAIEDAKKKHGVRAVRGSTLYVTLEPCSHLHFLKRTAPCTNAIIREGIARVVYAMKDPNPFVSGKGAKELRAKGITVLGPMNELEARAINQEYVKHMREQPFVSIKMAISVDGKTATRTGDSKWISGPESLEYVHKLRTQCDGVMVGAGTVCSDDPKLTSHGKGRDPYRIIIDGKLKIPIESKVLCFDDNRTILVTSESAPGEKLEKISKKIRNVIVCGKNGEIDLKKLMKLLGAMGIKKIMIEGGSELNASALEAGIVNQITLFIASKIIGGKDAKSMVGGLGIEKMSEAKKLKLTSFRKIGQDLMVEFDVC
jgi:diaminohydroxyphosphoribosylaminopyrimidine deaminase/5-amino-6-(5-phosphoribosylamino)uracil reductase